MQFSVVDALRDDTAIQRCPHMLVLSPCRLVDALPSRVPKTRCVLLAVAVLLRFAVGAAKPAAGPTRQRPPDAASTPRIGVMDEFIQANRIVGTVKLRGVPVAQQLSVRGRQHPVAPVDAACPPVGRMVRRELDRLHQQQRRKVLADNVVALLRGQTKVVVGGGEDRNIGRRGHGRGRGAFSTVGSLSAIARCGSDPERAVASHACRRYFMACQLADLP
jgi:hypothetical protein